MKEPLYLFEGYGRRVFNVVPRTFTRNGNGDIVTGMSEETFNAMKAKWPKECEADGLELVVINTLEEVKMERSAERKAPHPGVENDIH